MKRKCDIFALLSKLTTIQNGVYFPYFCGGNVNDEDLMKLGVGYTVVKMRFSCTIFGTVFCIPFNLYQHEMTKFSVWLLTKYLLFVFVMGVDLSLKSLKDILF